MFSPHLPLFLSDFALFCGLAFALFCAHLCVLTAFRTTAFGNCGFLSNKSVSAAQHINFISAQSTENGNPKIRNRDGPEKSGEVKVSEEFQQKPWVRGRDLIFSIFGPLGECDSQVARKSHLSHLNRSLFWGRHPRVTFVSPSVSRTYLGSGAF